MSVVPFRFLHASDLHLENPLRGIAHAPDHLRSLLLDAPYRAAERLFDLAIDRQVDFVLLAGDVLNPIETGPRGPAFLQEQFRRLEAHGIHVYWTAGRADPPHSWPVELRLPANVRFLAGEQAEPLAHHRGGLALCHIWNAGHVARAGISRFHIPVAAQPNLVLAYGRADAAALRREPVAYWALGGNHRAATRRFAGRVAHYPGTLQGRCPAESGAHGASLVEVHGDGRMDLTRLPCDRIRWHNVQLRVDVHTGQEHFEDMLRARLKELIAEAGETPLLVSWNVAGEGRVWHRLRHGTLAAEVLAALRSEFGMCAPLAWSVELTTQAPESYPAELRDQQTLLGDYLRVMEQHRSSGELPELAPWLEQPPAEVSRALWRVKDVAARQRLIVDAAALGVDLLHNES